MRERIELHKRPDGRWLVRRISDGQPDRRFEWVFATRGLACKAALVIAAEIDEANKTEGGIPCGR